MSSFIYRSKLFKKASKYLIEVLVIFIGVMMAFIADNWRENIQDREDFTKIMNEIKKDIRLDSIEILDDKSRVIHQINCLEMYLEDSTWEMSILDKTEVKRCFELILFFDRPDYVLTGFKQLSTSKIVSSSYDEELMASIYEYYQWTDYHYLRTNQAVADTYDLQKYYVENGFSPIEDDELTQNEIDALNRLRKDPSFIAQLKYLQLNRKEELRIYEYMQLKINNILALFEHAKDED